MTTTYYLLLDNYLKKGGISNANICN